jgi:PPP family 3-phenylpropionic acid transporter
MGLALTCATVSELAVFAVADRLLRRWSLRQLLVAALVVLALRLVAYAASTATWQVLLIQLLHGPTFALMWVAGVTSASRLAPDGLGATAQGLFSGANFGLSGAVGGLCGGALYEAFGGTGLYAAAALWVLVALAVYGVAGRRTAF